MSVKKVSIVRLSKLQSFGKDLSPIRDLVEKLDPVDHNQLRETFVLNRLKRAYVEVNRFTQETIHELWRTESRDVLSANPGIAPLSVYADWVRDKFTIFIELTMSDFLDTKVLSNEITIATEKDIDTHVLTTTHLIVNGNHHGFLDYPAWVSDLMSSRGEKPLLSYYNRAWFNEYLFGCLNLVETDDVRMTAEVIAACSTISRAMGDSGQEVLSLDAIVKNATENLRLFLNTDKPILEIESKEDGFYLVPTHRKTELVFDLFPNLKKLKQ